MTTLKKSQANWKILCFSALLIFCFVSLSFSQQEFVHAKVVYKVDGMDKVKVINDIIYKQAGGEDLKMDIYQPPNMKAGETLPAVIYVHGGSFSPDFPVKPKEWDVYKAHGRVIAASGLIGVTFNHRFYGGDKEKLTDSFSDVRDAILYVRANAAKYQIDPDRLCVWSFSGGGSHLSIPIRDRMDFVRCIVSYYGVLDLKSLVGSYGAGRDLEYLNDFSVINYLTFENYKIPPFFIARAGLDNPPLNSTIDSFVNKAFKMDLDIEVANHPGGVHGFEVFNDDHRTHEIMKDTISFIKKNLFSPQTPDEQLASLKGRLLTTLGNGEIQKVKDIIDGISGDLTAEQRDSLKTVLKEPVLNFTGYNLLGKGNTSKAIELFEWTVQLYPDSPNAYDSLADGYEAAGSTNLAVKSTEKTLQLIEKLPNLDKSVKNNLKKLAEERLQRLKKQ